MTDTANELNKNKLESNSIQPEEEIQIISVAENPSIGPSIDLTEYEEYPDPVIQEKRPLIRISDDLDSEFRYYSKLIQDLVLMPKNRNRSQILPWVHKLSSPGYNVVKLRDKRNRFMLMLCLSCYLSDDARTIFSGPPPVGILPDYKDVIRRQFSKYSWETDTMWEEQIKLIKEIEMSTMELPNEHEPIRRCYLHEMMCPKDLPEDINTGELLDKHFRFLLHICKPYLAMLFRSSDRIRAAKWIQMLCGVKEDHCIISKAIRNDYLMELSGHLVNQNLVGLFENFPSSKLYPLEEMSAMNKNANSILDPANPRTSEFFADIPTPEEGAFAFIAINGDLHQSKF